MVDGSTGHGNAVTTKRCGLVFRGRPDINGGRGIEKHLHLAIFCVARAKCGVLESDCSRTALFRISNSEQTMFEFSNMVCCGLWGPPRGVGWRAGPSVSRVAPRTLLESDGGSPPPLAALSSGERWCAVNSLPSPPPSPQTPIPTTSIYPILLHHFTSHPTSRLRTPISPHPPSLHP